MEVATFGGGCFWCTEAVFQRLDGVEQVVSGYSGGQSENPSYEQICTGRSGHAEVIRIEFDPEKISYTKLLEVFFRTHDPTTLNQQGNDRGTQYRSVVYYHSMRQRQQAEEAIEAINAEQIYSKPIVTEVTAAPKFYPAEKYHQDYYNQNPSNGYCQFVVKSKVDKLKKLFADLLEQK